MAFPPPYALFILIEDVDIAWLNKSLQRAREGDYDSGWSFWVATDNDNDIPRDKGDEPTEGTQPPVPKDFVSPWIGKSILECGEWLRRIPADTELHPFLFAVITEHSKGDDAFTACQFYDPWNEEDPSVFDVEYFPQNIDQVSMQFWTNGGSKFYEKQDGYKATREYNGEPSRSYRRPYTEKDC